MGQTCSNGGSWNAFKNVCCAPPGTPPEGDPCSILNDPGFIAAQAAAVGPLGPNGVPLSSPSFSDYGGVSPTNLADIAFLPNNVQQDVITCSTNPGAVFTDPTGMRVTCPSGTSDENGIFVSNLTYAQLAAQLAPQLGGTPYLAGNSPFGVTVNRDPAILPVSTPAIAVASPSSGSGAGSASGAGAGSGQSSPVPASSDSIDLSSLETGSVAVGGLSIPYWAIAAGLVGAFFLFGGRR